MLNSASYKSALGDIILVSDGNNIINLCIKGQKYFNKMISANLIYNNNCPVLLKGKKWLDEYFASKKPRISELPLLPKGSPFQQDVWKILTNIPYGETITYGDIAKQLEVKYNKKMSAQAVGGAVGHNQILIIIPCHRVVGRNGCLTGYAGGIDKKIELLQHENIDITKFSVPNKK